jgi:hypothetical protein
MWIAQAPARRLVFVLCRIRKAARIEAGVLWEPPRGPSFARANAPADESQSKAIKSREILDTLDLGRVHIVLEQCELGSIQRGQLGHGDWDAEDNHPQASRVHRIVCRNADPVLAAARLPAFASASPAASRSRTLHPINA